MSDTSSFNSDLLDMYEELSRQQIDAKDALRTLEKSVNQETIRKACSLQRVDSELEAVKQTLRNRGYHV